MAVVGPVVTEQLAFLGRSFCMKTRLMAFVAVMLASVVAYAAAPAIGDSAPEFKAAGVDGKTYTLGSFKEAKATVVVFTCNICPVAVAYEDRFIEFAKKYDAKGVKFIAINVNTSEDLSAMKQRAEEKGFNFPYAYDETGDSARAFGARVTPHLFVVDAKGKIVYQGAFDDSMNKPTKPYLANAVEAVLAGKTPEVTNTKAVGCGIRPKAR